MRAVAFAILIWLAGAIAPAVALDLPQLTGRVVDNAGILSAEAKARLETKLAEHETKTTDQIVVATVPSLQGDSVEEFANQLFRAWKLGQAKTNNGVLLLVAPNERKVRFEVGYGLEGTLTDALSKVIISSAVAPKFKTGDFSGGIEAGVDAVTATLLGDEEWQQRARVRDDSNRESGSGMALVVFAFIVLFVLMSQGNRTARQGSAPTHRRRNGRWVAIPTSGPIWGGGSGGWSGGGSWGGSGGGGGFSGGGGSSGGGGASGDW